MRAVAATPSQRGMFRSMRTTCGFVAATSVDGGLAVGRLARHGDAGQRPEQQDQALADRRLVVRDHDGNGIA